MANELGNTKLYNDILEPGNGDPGDIVVWPNPKSNGHTGVVGCDGEIYSATKEGIQSWNYTTGLSLQQSLRYRTTRESGSSLEVRMRRLMIALAAMLASGVAAAQPAVRGANVPWAASWIAQPGVTATLGKSGTRVSVFQDPAFPHVFVVLDSQLCWIADFSRQTVTTAGCGPLAVPGGPAQGMHDGRIRSIRAWTAA